MEFLAALVVLVGNVCYFADPKSKLSVAIWISSVFVGTMAALCSTFPEKSMIKATLICVFVFSVFLEIGFWRMYKWFKKNTP